MADVYILGGGRGAEVALAAIDAINHEAQPHSVFNVAGILDDDESRHNDIVQIQGVTRPIVSASIKGDIGYLKHESVTPSPMLICSSSNIAFRQRCWDMYQGRWSWLSLLRSEFKGYFCGDGNIIFPDVHTDYFVEIGDNNVISAGTVVAHHSTIGSHNLLGPGCFLSGSVRIGDCCRLGSGIVIEPCVTIGDNCDIASGTVIVSDLPDGTAIKARRSGSIYTGERMAGRGRPTA